MLLIKAFDFGSYILFLLAQKELQPYHLIWCLKAHLLIVRPFGL